jgi:hypothetical protein
VASSGLVRAALDLGMQQENPHKIAVALAVVDEALERARERRHAIDLVGLYEAHEAFAVVALAMAAREVGRGLWDRLLHIDG